MDSTLSGESENSWARKPRARLYTHSSQAGLIIATVWWMGCQRISSRFSSHYCDVIMGAMASQITSLPLVYSIVHSGAGQRKHQSSASLAFVRGIYRWPVNAPHKWPVTRTMFPFDDVTMMCKTQLPDKLVFKMRKYDRITPALIMLHSLPIKYRIEFKTGPRLNIKTVLSTYGDFHVKDKTVVRTSYL